MATISIQECRGQLPAYGVESVDVVRPGQDGNVFWHLGQRGVETQIWVAARLADQTAWDTYNANIRSYVGAVHTLSHSIDGWTKTVYVKQVLPAFEVSRSVVNSSDGTTKRWEGVLVVVPTA